MIAAHYDACMLIDSNKERTMITQAQRVAAARLYTKGYTVTETAKALKLDRYDVRESLRSYGFVVR